VIDLHLHTAASDGLLPPADLVERIQAAGISAFSVTDHDTVAGLEAAADAAAARGMRFVTGIEVTAIQDGRDLHMLGYGIDPRSPALLAFLEKQRELRRHRVHLVLDRLAALGVPIDPAPVLASDSEGGRTVGRPHVAREMVRAGYVRSVSEAFDSWLATGRPAFVPRDGASPAEVVAVIHEAGGVAAMAHPGVTNRDGLLTELVAHGLDALEVWHSDHDEAAARRYAALAGTLGLLMTGGSDFHGDGEDRVNGLGRVGMPEQAFSALLARLEGSGARLAVAGAQGLVRPD
jgi:predicted metal-dependent phosphoesterase TrpH